MTRPNIKLLLVLLVVLESVAYINSYVFDLIAATVDAGRFQDEAVIWARYGQIEFVTDAQFFIQYLGLIFRIFGESEFIATQFGLMAFMYGLYLLQKIMHMENVKYVSLVIVLVALWPSSITRITTTMREPYLILIVIAICYHLIIYSKTSSFKNCLYALIWATVGAFFHKAYAVLFVGVCVFIAFRDYRSSFRQVALKLVVGVFIVSAIFAFEDTISQVKGLKPIYSLMSQDTEYMSRVVEYKANRDFRTTYEAKIDFDSPLAFVLTAPYTYFYYMHAPMPWRATTPLDIYASAEGIFRLIALMLLIRGYTLGYFKNLNSSTVIILMLTFVWAAGTSNYGTASRHHITTNWYFFLIFAYYYTAKASNRKSKLRRRRKLQVR